MPKQLDTKISLTGVCCPSGKDYRLELSPSKFYAVGEMMIYKGIAKRIVWSSDLWLKRKLIVYSIIYSIINPHFVILYRFMKMFEFEKFEVFIRVRIWKIICSSSKKISVWRKSGIDAKQCIFFE